VNLAAWLLEGRHDSPDVAVLEGDRAVTYRELFERTCRFAGLVREALARRPDRVVVPIVAENGADQIAAYLGILFAGGVPAPLGPMSDEALGAVLVERDPALVLCDQAQLVRVRAQASSTCAVVPLDGEPSTPPLREPVTLARDEELQLLLYTSGSTGLPRGVMLSRRNLVANCRSIQDAVPLTAADRALAILPHYYCYGLSVLHTHLRAGACLVVGRFDFPEDVLARVEQAAVTGLPGVPGFFRLLLQRSSLKKRPLPHLRYVMLSGGRLDDASLRALQETLPGARVFVRYGVTELTAAASILSPEDLLPRLGSIGRGLPGMPLRVERKDGTPVTPGSSEIGEIVAEGEHVTLGYLNDANGTGEHYRERRFHTGDLATVDADGFIFIVGRERDFVKTAGHRVAPQEVEHVLAAMPEVLEVAVFGMPHETRGEILAALVVAASPSGTTGASLRHACSERLPAFKVPFEIRIVASLPKTSNGKIRRGALRACFDAAE